MPKAAFCSECNRYVWMTDTGCENGHPKSCLRNVHEAFVLPPASPATDIPLAARGADGRAASRDDLPQPDQTATLDTDVFPRRVLALLVDTLMTVAIFVGLRVVSHPHAAGVSALPRALTPFPPSAGMALGFTTLLYFVGFEASRLRATPGKLLLSLKVVSADGGAPTYEQIYARNLSRILDNLPLCIPGLVSSLISPQRQRVGDHVAGTLVIRRR